MSGDETIGFWGRMLIGGKWWLGLRLGDYGYKVFGFLSLLVGS